MTTEHVALQRLKEVCEKATPGPWRADIRTGVYSVYPAETKHNCLSDVSDEIARENGRGEESQPGGYRYLTEEQQGNATFIATARTAMPALIEYCERLEQLAALVEPAKAIDWLEDQGWSEEHVVRVTNFKKQHNTAIAAVEAARARLEKICQK